MEFYYIINYYFKYLELFDTIFLVLKKKPLRKYAVSVMASVIDLLQLHRISPCLPSFRDGFIMFHAAQRKNQHCQCSDSRNYSSHSVFSVMVGYLAQFSGARCHV